MRLCIFLFDSCIFLIQNILKQRPSSAAYGTDYFSRQLVEK